MIHERDDYRCVNCGSTHRLEAHHIVPISEGGENDPANITTLCHSCHLKAEKKRERNDVSSLKTGKTYSHLVTPHEVRDLFDQVRHPLTRALLVFHSYYGIG
ncbi:HNH endonuclease [Natrialbaceae archaeon A-gly3]